MAAVVRAMTLGQNFHHQLNNCIIVKPCPDTPPPSTAGSPPLLINSPTEMHHHAMLGKRTIAPALAPHKGSSATPVIRFSGNDVKNTCSAVTKNSSTKRLNYNNHLSQYTTGPMPSVERRNARERNRVKQVNNGFDKLRQYIPAKIVEVENGGRGVSKKLSKVDTLKLAVKYIQRLKEMLDENNSRLPQQQTSEVPSARSLSTSSYYSASPAPSSHNHHHLQHHAAIYASTPVSSYQEYNHSEPSVSPAPSFHSDVSSHHPHQPQQSVYQMQNVQFTDEEPAYAKGYSHEQFVDEDSGSFEEDGILDDILQWQMQH